MLAGAGFYLVSQGAFLMIVVHAFRQTLARGLMTMFVPFYALYHVITNARETWKYFAACILFAGIGVALFVAAIARGEA